MTTLPRRTRQTIAVLLAGIVLAAVAGVVAVPLRAHLSALQDEAAAKREIRERYSRALASLQVPDQSGERSLPEDAASFTLPGAIVSIAIAELQSHLNSLASEAGLRFSSLSALPLREEDGLRLVAAQAQFQASMETLQRLLHAIDASRPLLTVTGLSLRATGGAPQPEDLDPATPVSDRTPERMLSIQITVQGAMSPTEAAQ